MNRLTSISLPFAALSVLVAASVASAVTPVVVSVTDFEDAAYVAGSPVTGVDGWAFGASSKITSATTTPPIVLDGAKSLTVPVGFATKKFVGNPGFLNGVTFSTLMSIAPGATSNATIYLSNDIAGTATPGGIRMDADTNLFKLDAGGPTAPTLFDTAFINGDTYRIDMVVTFSDGITPGSFHAYETDLAGGGTIDLGTLGLPTAFTAANVSANGGFIPYSNGAVATFDDLTYTLVPEPASLTLIALAAVAVVRRRRAA